MQSTTAKIVRDALDKIRELIRSSTTSMTSVPKPLKFLRPLIDDIKKSCETLKNAEHRVRDNTGLEITQG